MKAKRIIVFILILSLAVAFVSCKKNEITMPDSSDAISADTLAAQIAEHRAEASALRLQEVDYGEVEIGDDFDFSEISNYVRIDVTGFGSMIIYLRDDVAPATVNNFKKNVLCGFYDGLVFHRVQKDFIVEGGEQDKDGVIHDTDMIYGEFSDNNFTNNLKHTRGVISMSRKNIPDSASSGFFIVCNDAPQLDSRYAAFGYIIDGLDVLEKIEAAAVGANDKPQEPIIIEKIQFMTKVEIEQ